jgi:signal transduction histidine kinase
MVSRVVGVFKQPRNLMVFLAGAVLIGYMVFLIMGNYTSQMELRRVAAALFLEDEQSRTQVLSCFFSEKKREMADLAGSREISIYFENKALGMTMAYGLRASIIGMENRFRQIMAGRGLGEAPLYKGIAFVDAQGTAIAAVGELEDMKRKDDWISLTDPNDPALHVLVEKDDELQGAIISSPCRFKGAYVGQAVALIDMESVRHHFFDPMDDLVQRRLLVDGGRTGDEAVSEGASVSGVLRDESALQAKRTQESILSRVAVEGTPFILASSIPAYQVYGQVDPKGLFLATGALGIFILGIAIYFVVVSTRNRVLQARVEESAARQKEIQEKNLALEAFRRNLEQMVEERTAQLKQVQKELLIKATEAGRAQMAAVVLHNIGNAVTPAMVQVDQMKNDELKGIASYLDRCWSEFKDHAADLGRYVTEDPRGKQVAAYVETLIQELEKHSAERDQRLERIENALFYVADILSLEQSYGTDALRNKETVDLNRLLEDGLRLQKGSIQQRQIEVVKKLVDDPVLLRIDKAQLMHVILNLLRNSYEAIDQMNDASAQRRIEIMTFREDGRAGFQVRDTGIGLGPGDVEQYFEFGRSIKGSSGFGLTYCREYVEANNGHIELTSPGPGKGATVKVVFEGEVP